MPAFKWEEQKTPRYRYLIYGVPGVGKTTLSASLPGKTYMLSLDGSFTRIKLTKETRTSG
ncbi:AAA family ATPase [Lactobacillus delbrueckii]|uniref:AAA family ATPase n=1 Tax=Lactobacillus delbrueckii TaxID=1584 RepID=UPI0035CFC272